MSDYSVATNFAAKDSLPSGNASKAVLGADISAELAAIATMSSTKEDKVNKNANSGYAGLDASARLTAALFPAFTGDVTTTAGGIATTIGAATVTLAKMANLAANSIIGNNTGSPAVPLALTGAQVLALLSSGGMSVPGGAFTPNVALTFNTTTTAVNCALSNVFTLAMTANITAFPNFTNPGDGQTIVIFITQDGTGNRTITWPANFKWAGGTPGVLSTAASAVDMLGATYRSATSSWHATLNKAYA